MSFKFKFTIGLFFVLALGMPLILKGPDGQPIMSLDDWMPDVSSLDMPEQIKNVSVDSLTSIIQSESIDPISESTQDTKVVQSAGGNEMYKWQDENGRWHFSSEKPSDSQQVSIEKLPDVKNVMEAPVTEDKKSSTINLPGGLGFGGG